MIVDYENKAKAAKFADELQAALDLHERALIDLKDAYSKATEQLAQLKRQQIAEQMSDTRPNGIPDADGERAPRLPQAFVFLDRDPLRQRLEEDCVFYSGEINRIAKKIEWLRNLGQK